MMRLKLIKSDDEDLNYAVLNYKNVYDDYNISIINGTLENIEIKKTVATKVGNDSTNLTITKYWFDKNGTIYNIQSINGSEIIDKNAKEIIDSIR